MENPMETSDYNLVYNMSKLLQISIPFQPRADHRVSDLSTNRRYIDKRRETIPDGNWTE